MTSLQVLLLSVTIAGVAVAVPLKLTNTNSSVLYEWSYLDYTFGSDSIRQSWIRTGKYKPDNNVPFRLKVFGNRTFLTIGRLRSGVPATLATVPYNSSADSVVTNALLTPYPSWSMNFLGNCSAIQHASAIEIDPYGRLWVMDTGRTNTESRLPSTKCPPKLWLFDLKSDALIHTYVIPEEVMCEVKGFLRHVAVGCLTREDCWAYISNSGESRIVAYSLKCNRAWYVSHETMKGNLTTVNIKGIDGRMNGAVNGVALSPETAGFAFLYYKTLSSVNLYRISTAIIQSAVMRTRYGGKLQSKYVRNMGATSALSDGIAMDTNGTLYYGQLGLNSVSTWNSESGALNECNTVELMRETALDWPAGIALLNNANRTGLVLSNGQQKWPNGYDFCDINFRIYALP